jgi:GMP synthase (glutamine-hydrolysing)
MPRAVILQHVEFEGPARIAELLLEAGYELDVRALYAGDRVPSELELRDLLVVMGGPMGVADLGRSEYPFLQAEVELLRQRVAENAPRRARRPIRPSIRVRDLPLPAGLVGYELHGASATGRG